MVIDDGGGWVYFVRVLEVDEMDVCVGLRVMVLLVVGVLLGGIGLLRCNG